MPTLIQDQPRLHRPGSGFPGRRWKLVLVMLVFAVVLVFAVAGWYLRRPVWSQISPVPSKSWMVVSPTFATDHTLFALINNAENEVYASHSAGETWALLEGVTATGSHLVFSPTYARDRTLAVASELDGTITTSTDGGITWTPPSPLPGDHRGILVAVVGSSPPTVFVNTSTYDPAMDEEWHNVLYRSTAGGASWVELASMRAESPLSALMLSPTYATDHTIFAHMVGGGGLYRSVDDGRTWVNIDVSGHPADSIDKLIFSLAYAHDQTIFVESNTAVWRSTDAGTSWTKVTPDLGVCRTPLELVATAPRTLLVATGPRYFGGGSTRYPPPRLLQPALLQISLDNGATWQQQPIPQLSDRPDHWNACPQALAVSPAYPHDPTMLLATNDQVLLSNDAGATWTMVFESDSARYYLASYYSHQGRVFAQSDEDIYAFDLSR